MLSIGDDALVKEPYKDTIVSYVGKVVDVDDETGTVWLCIDRQHPQTSPIVELIARHIGRNLKDFPVRLEWCTAYEH